MDDNPGGYDLDWTKHTEPEPTTPYTQPYEVEEPPESVIHKE